MHTIPFPLFHGTSSAFASSILKQGVGSCNPVAEMRGVECLRVLASIAEKHLEGDHEWMAERHMIEAMSHQRVSGGGFNYRHGTVYCSPAKSIAVRYALSNAYGSELLSTCLNLYAKLRAFVPDRVGFIETEFYSLFLLAQEKPEPILIELKNLFASSLLTEQGHDPSERIKRISSASTPTEKIALQQCNFELTKPIFQENFNIWRIIPLEIDMPFSKYDLEPYVQPM